MSSHPHFTGTHYHEAEQRLEWHLINNVNLYYTQNLGETVLFYKQFIIVLPLRFVPGMATAATITGCHLDFISD